MTPSDVESKIQDGLAEPSNRRVVFAAILKEQLSRLTDEVVADLCRLLPVFVSENEEETTAAAQAVYELLIPKKGAVSAVDLSQSESPSVGMTNWLRFVSRQLREAREQSGLTQSQLAEKCGLPQSHISRLENGQHSPTSKTLEKISEALGLSVSYFDPSQE